MRSDEWGEAVCWCVLVGLATYGAKALLERAVLKMIYRRPKLQEQEIPEGES